MYVYINTQCKNNTDNFITATSNEMRTNNIINDTELYHMSVDRWFIIGGYFPVFKSSNDLYIVITNTTTGDTSSHYLTFPTSDNNGFIYSINDFVESFNNSLEMIFNDLSLTEPLINLSFDYSNNKFSLNVVNDFEDYYLSLSNTLGIYLSSFPFMTFDGIEWILNFNETITQNAATIDYLCPVCRITIESDMPIIQELIPAPAGMVSRNVSNVVSDYKYNQRNINPIQSLLYNADGNHRWQSMTNNNNFKRFRINYFWIDYDNNKYPLQLIKGGIAEAKIVFKKVIE